MAAPSDPHVGANPVPVVGLQFCMPHVVDLVIARKVMTLAEGSFGITDVNGNIMFKVKGKVFSIRDRRVLLDPSDNPIVSFQQKILTAHRRWQAFRGDSTNSENIVFSVRKSSLLQFKTKLDVFLACNTKEDVCDFRIEGSWMERSCTIYAGESSTIVAQMHKKLSAQSLLLGKDTFAVTVYPNVDYGLIAALIVILEEINEDRDD